MKKITSRSLRSLRNTCYLIAVITGLVGVIGFYWLNRLDKQIQATHQAAAPIAKAIDEPRQKIVYAQTLFEQLNMVDKLWENLKPWAIRWEREPHREGDLGDPRNYLILVETLRTDISAHRELAANAERVRRVRAEVKSILTQATMPHEQWVKKVREADAVRTLALTQNEVSQQLAVLNSITTPMDGEMPEAQQYYAELGRAKALLLDLPTDPDKILTQEQQLVRQFRQGQIDRAPLVGIRYYLKDRPQLPLAVSQRLQHKTDTEELCLMGLCFAALILLRFGRTFGRDLEVASPVQAET